MIEKREVQELFPTPLWIADLQPAAATALNAKLKAEIERLIEPKPKIPVGGNWQRHRTCIPGQRLPSS